MIGKVFESQPIDGNSCVSVSFPPTILSDVSSSQPPASLSEDDPDDDPDEEEEESSQLSLISNQEFASVIQIRIIYD